MKNIFSVRGILGILLVLSVLFAFAATYYKIKVWGFSAVPNEKTEVWTIDAHISFKPTGKPIEISLAVPSGNGGYKILSEDAAIFDIFVFIRLCLNEAPLFKNVKHKR